MVGRRLVSADFQRLLATPSRSRSAHFVLHHLPARPVSIGRAQIHCSSTELSTDDGQLMTSNVEKQPESSWLAIVVPKRHARRSVTRNLIRRQIRSVMAAREAELPKGMWLVQLRSSFDSRRFVSAASDALRRAARAELELLVAKANVAPPTSAKLRPC